MKSKSTPRRIVRSVVLLSVLAPASLYAQIDGDEGDDDDDIVVEEGDEDEDETEEGEEQTDEPTDETSDESPTEEDEEVVEEDDSDAEDDAEEEDDGEQDEVSDLGSNEPAPSAPVESEPKELVEPSIPTKPGDEELAEQASQAALVDAPSREVSLSPITFTTSTFTRFEYREGYDDLGVSRGRFSEGDAFVFRARLGMRTNPLPIADGSDVFIQFTPQASGIWGTNGTVGEANLGIYEGYLQFRTKRLGVQVGRIMMDYGDAVVIGNLGWHQTARAFDGVRTHYEMNQGYLDIFATQVAQNWGTAGGGFFAGDDVFWGAYLGIGHYLHSALDLDAYFLGLSNFKQQGFTDAQTGAEYELEGAQLMTVGLRLKQTLGMFFYRLEGGVQFGSISRAPDAGFTGSRVGATKQLAYQVNGELGLSLSTRTRLAVGGAIASGDDPDTDKSEGWYDLYPTGHKWLGLMDVIGDRTNIGSGNVSLRQELFERLSGQVDGHIFARLQDGGLGSQGGAGLAGSEVDVQLIQGLGKYAQVRGLYGLFIPTSGQYKSDDLTHYLEIEAGVNF